MKTKIYASGFILIACFLTVSCKQEKKPNDQAKNIQGSFSISLENKPTADDINLINQIKQGNTRRVKAIIESGKAGIYSANEAEQTALMAAAENKNREVADIILDKMQSGDKNALDRGDSAGKTALIYAASVGAVDIIHDLRKKGADVNAYDHDKNTPLLIAVKTNFSEAAEAILENMSDAVPANPDLRNSAGETAALAATINKNNALLKTLKDYGADLNIPNETGVNPLANGVSSNNKTLFDYLLTLGANINYLIGGQKTVLSYAIDSGNYDFAKYILDKGADPNIHATVLPTPLQELVSKEKADPAMIDMMINKGAKLSGTDMPGGNVISWAIHKGNAPAIKKLIEKGAKISDLETPTSSGILMAINIGDPEIAALMIESGSDVSKPNGEGFSPLAFAAKNDYEDLFVELIKKGADVNSVSRNKYATPLEIVFATNNSNLLKIMFDNGLKVSPDAVLLRAINEKKGDLVTVALAYGARANIMNSSGQPAIWLATAKDDTKAVEDLVDNSALLDVQDTEKGIQPLSLAILRGNQELAKYLIEKGANPNLPDKRGYTALTYAAVTGQDDLVKILLEHKASVQVVDTDGKTLPQLIDLSKIPKPKKDTVKNLISGK